MNDLNFKELGKTGKFFQVLQYKRVYKATELPNNEKKEIVFIGKSNVGKSSLINVLLNYKVNKVSKTPGCTKWIGFLELPTINIIDLPGYGYSKVSQSRRNFWDLMVNEYIKENRCYLVFVLIDSRKEICGLDEQVLNMFAAFNTEIIYTKHDRRPLKDGVFTSTKSGHGIIALREKLVNI